MLLFAWTIYQYFDIVFIVLDNSFLNNVIEISALVKLILKESTNL